MKKCWIGRGEAGNIDQRCNGTHGFGYCSAGVILAIVALCSSSYRNVFEAETWAGPRERSMRWEVSFGERAVGKVEVVEVLGDLREHSGDVGEGR